MDRDMLRAVLKSYAKVLDELKDIKDAVKIISKGTKQNLYVGNNNTVQENNSKGPDKTCVPAEHIFVNNCYELDDETISEATFRPDKYTNMSCTPKNKTTRNKNDQKNNIMVDNVRQLQKTEDKFAKKNNYEENCNLASANAFILDERFSDCIYNFRSNSFEERKVNSSPLKVNQLNQNYDSTKRHKSEIKNIKQKIIPCNVQDKNNNVALKKNCAQNKESSFIIPLIYDSTKNNNGCFMHKIDISDKLSQQNTRINTQKINVSKKLEADVCNIKNKRVSNTTEKRKNSIVNHKKDKQKNEIAQIINLKNNDNTFCNQNTPGSTRKRKRSTKAMQRNNDTNVNECNTRNTYTNSTETAKTISNTFLQEIEDEQNDNAKK